MKYILQKEIYKRIEKVGNILIIRLDPFEDQTWQMVHQKTFPNTSLTINGKYYLLKAVVQRGDGGGSYKSGHFKTFVRNNCKWIERSDSHFVEDVNIPEYPYLLFYEQEAYEVPDWYCINCQEIFGKFSKKIL